MYEVRLSRRAKRYYERVPPDIVRLLDRCFAALQVNPFAGVEIKPLKGEPGTYRARVGDLRVVYEVDRRARIVEVHLILPRGEAYRR
jgi:mRNA interferase RelE/StbE